MHETARRVIVLFGLGCVLFGLLYYVQPDEDMEPESAPQAEAPASEIPAPAPEARAEVHPKPVETDTKPAAESSEEPAREALAPHVRKSKLHLPVYLRPGDDPRIAPSKAACTNMLERKQAGETLSPAEQRTWRACLR